MAALKDKVARLSCWSAAVEPEYLTGGLTNVNFVVRDGAEKFVVRAGLDIPEHLILRFNELAAARAAERIGISPAIVHTEPGIMVMRYIEGRTLTEADVRDPRNLERIIPLIQRCHHDLRTELRGPALAFWPFHVIRSYGHTLRESDSRVLGELPRYLDVAARLERAVGPTSIVFGHNDLLAANFIDDGERIWLVDWDYAGFGSPLFDLGGLSSNNELSEDQERWVLEAYFDAPVTDGLWYRFKAMKCASLLRESMWSMVSELHSAIEADYEAYTAENLRRFEHAWSGFMELGR